MNRKSLLLSVTRAAICLIVAGALIVPAPRSVASAASTISLRSLRTGTNGAGATSLNLAEPAGTQLGDVLVAQIAINSSGTVITAPSGWHLILTTQSSTSFEEATFYKVVTASEPASYTWTFAAKHPATGAIDCFIGADTARPIDASSGKYNSSTATVSFTQITTTAPSDMLLAFVAVSGNTTVTPPAGFTEEYDVKNTASSNGKTAEQSQAVKASSGLTSVGSGREDTLSVSNLAQLIALRAASGSPSPTPTRTAATSTPTRTPTSTPTTGPTSTPTSAPTSTPTSGPSSTPTNTPTSSPTFTPTFTATATSSPAPGDIVVAAVGDMECTTVTCQDAHTADLVSGMNPAAYLPLGDLVFNSAYSNFVNFYDPVWGAFRSIAYPAIGNHEGDGTGYFDYWNGAGIQTGQAGVRGKGWYSFDIGSWHFVALNTNCVSDSLRVDCQPGSEQIAWLDADLAANQSLCTIAFMHHPYYSSGTRQYPELQTIFQTLYDHHVELYLAGHTHYYQRFRPQDANANRDDVNGVTEIVPGTGGGALANVGNSSTYKNIAVQIGKTFGVLKLVLHESSYDFQFVPVAGSTSTDSGTGTCH